VKETVITLPRYACYRDRSAHPETATGGIRAPRAAADHLFRSRLNPRAADKRAGLHARVARELFSRGVQGRFSGPCNFPLDRMASHDTRRDVTPGEDYRFQRRTSERGDRRVE